MVTSKPVFFLFALFCILFFSAAIDARMAIAEEMSEKNAYRIDVGDALEINVWKEQELTRQVVVRLDGRISLPLVGDVMAAGKTPMELAKILEKKIGEIIEEPTVTVILTASNSRVYYMVGNISNPGAFPMTTPLNLLQAIAAAGGLGEWAKKDEIIIVRRTAGKDEMLSFDYEKFVKGKDLSQNIMIEYGDTIIIP